MLVAPGFFLAKAKITEPALRIAPTWKVHAWLLRYGSDYWMSWKIRGIAL